jgi:hypothetical protein
MKTARNAATPAMRIACQEAHAFRRNAAKFAELKADSDRWNDLAARAAREEIVEAWHAQELSLSKETPKTAREIAELATTTAQAIFDALNHTSPPELINAAEAAMAHATIARLEAAAAAVSTTKIGRARHVAYAFACAREVTNQAGIASAIAAPLVAPTSPAVAIALELMANTEDLYQDRVDHPTFAARSRALWDGAEAEGLSDRVRDCLRMNRTTSWEG